MRDNFPASIMTPEVAVANLPNCETEYLYVFENGKRKFFFKGTKNNVSVSNFYLPQFAGCTLVHNHPGGSSFSPEDVIGVIGANAKEIILVTKTHRYDLKRPGENWGIDPMSSAFKDSLEVCCHMAGVELQKLIADGMITIEERDVEYFHYIWIFFFQMNGIEYGRKQIRKA